MNNHQRILDLFQLLQADHPLWEFDERLVTVWAEALGATSWPILQTAARRYLAHESGRPQLAKFLKYLPAGIQARARGEVDEASRTHDRDPEVVFLIVLRDCSFRGVGSLYDPSKPYWWHVDAYHAWRKENPDDLALTPPEHWRGDHLRPPLLLAMLDRRACAGTPRVETLL